MTMRHSPLDASHRALGAKMVEFGGWDMPLSYPGGTIAEHMACRTDVVVFDVSHLGTVRVEGPDVFDRLQMALSNDLRRIEPGRAQYTHLLDPSDASVVDDIIVWWRRSHSFDVMPNASNTSSVRDAIGGVDVTPERAVIAVQGPNARTLVAKLNPAAASVAHFGVAEFEWADATCVVAGTGYTGEDGVELAVPASLAISLWDALLGAGAQPAGLGARDTLRLEAGLPLHGHELGAGITPLQAGLGWVVGWDKDDFRGRAALVAEREGGPRRRLRGLATETRQPPRSHDAVWAAGERVGEVTSGNFSPVLGYGIALALIDASIDEGHELTLDVRGRHVPARVVPTPFVTKSSPAGKEA
ncbi:MAG: glycine cleavage system aminomethyltransferase GcvT [Acidimicrobiales bacterium]